MTNKKVSVGLVILATLVLIAVVIWVFDKRIQQIEKRAEAPSVGIRLNESTKQGE